MSTKNEREKESRKVPGAKSPSQSIADANSNRELGQASGSTEDQPIRSSGESSTLSDTGTGTAITGGILRRLIRDSLRQISSKEAEIKALQESIKEFEALLQNIEGK